MPPSLRQILASRAKGARSRGPKPTEGKLRFSQNALRHGLLAKQVVLSNEDRDSYDQLLSQYLDHFGPTDAVELGPIEKMAAAYWRQRRTWAMETRLIENAMAARQGDEVDRITDAFSEWSRAPDLSLLHRYETRLHRIFQRALYNLLLLRATATLPSGSTPEPPPPRSLPPARPVASKPQTPDQ